ncbi:MAG: hypothetical protein WBE26_11325 [Phycisphaerae bacterium]
MITKEEQPVGRQRCPTCNAPRQGGAICHRCKSDLAILIQLEHHVDALRRRARRYYARGWYRQASSLAQAVVSLEPSPEDLRLLACARLLCGDFAGAWRVMLRCGERCGERGCRL